MSDGEKNIIQKAKEQTEAVKQDIENVKQDVENVKKIATKLAGGNKLGAVKEAIKMALKKLKDKKFIKRVITQLLIKALPIIIAVAILFGIFSAIKDKMIMLMAGLSKVGGFFVEAWQWLTNDYWTDINEKIEYVVDANTGETLGTKESIKQTYVDEVTGYIYDYYGNRHDENGNILDNNGKIREITTRSYTLVDEYVRELGNNGVSIKELRLLGDANYEDYDTIEKLLEDENNKELVEKYIAEFIRADIITQQPHRNRTAAVVNPQNQNLVDGGVYFYRNKRDEELKEEDFSKGEYNETNIVVDEKDYKKMEYRTPEEFLKEIGKEGANISELVDSGETIIVNKEGKGEELKYIFTIDPKTDNMVLFEVKTITTRESDTTDGWFQNLSQWFQEATSKKTQYELKLVETDYKSMISKYSMPYEFLINLCEITQNPEFVYHVALLARDTKITLVIQDNTDQIIETNEEEEDYETWENGSSDSFQGASLTGTETKRKRKITTTTTYAPVLRPYSADTWSFYEEFLYTKDIEGTIDQGELITTRYEYPGKLSGYHPPDTETQVAIDGGYVSVPIPGTEYYYDTILVETRSQTQTITSKITYNEATLAFEPVEKSKQFLGLLINETGECSHDCSSDKVSVRYDPIALDCARDAVFDDVNKECGNKVKYRIPNMTITEEPYNKLISGLEMLYATLQSNGIGYDKNDERLLTKEQTSERYDIQDERIANRDYESAYVVKMQGLVEHLQYLMTLPDNEEYDPKTINSNDDVSIDEDYEENIISGSEFWWPLDENVECRISSYFGKRTAPTAGASTYHKGIDIARPNGATTIEGTAIIASADGVVTVSGYSESAGYWIAIDHGNGYVTKYMHNMKNVVSVGDTVSRGQVIGYLGNTGRSTGAHLHFQIELNGVAQNPLNYVSMKTKRQTTGGKVTVDDATKLDVIYAVVTTECSADYEGALAVISCVLNRCNSSDWANYGGNDPYLQITATGQFSYGISQYKNRYKAYLNGNVPSYVKQAVDDALSGKRNHNYTSFRTDSAETRKMHSNGESIGGNWYF